MNTASGGRSSPACKLLIFAGADCRMWWSLLDCDRVRHEDSTRVSRLPAGRAHKAQDPDIDTAARTPTLHVWPGRPITTVRAHTPCPARARLEEFL